MKEYKYIKESEDIKIVKVDEFLQIIKNTK